MRGVIVDNQSALGRAAVGVDTTGTLHVDRVPWFGRWHGADGVWQPVSQLNEPARANATALFTPVWGAKTPSTHGTMVVLGTFPPATPSRDLSGVVQSVFKDSSVVVTADGAVFVALGSAARTQPDQEVAG